MYDLNSVVIAAVLLISMLAFIEIGYRLGALQHRHAEEPVLSQVNAIQASLLGILALLLGFTFSLALQRFDGRSEAVVLEANAIGTALLRSGLLPDGARQATRAKLADYIELRIESGEVSVARRDDHARSLAQAAELQQDLWTIAEQAARSDPNPVTTGLYVQSLNDLIDALSTRDAALERHVPEVVLFLLYGTFLMTGMIVGYASGMAGRRTSLITYILVALIVLLVFIIVDLDRPRRGLIEVDQGSLKALQQLIEQASGAKPSRF